MLVRSLCLVAVCAAALPGCGGDRDATRVYFIDGYRSSLGMRGRLVAVERDLADPGLGRVVAEVLRGPTAAERGDRGLLTGFGPGVEVETVALANGTARVDLRCKRPPRTWPADLYATAQLLYTLTEREEVSRLALRVNGRPCCVYDMQSRPRRKPVDRRTFAGWQGEPVDVGRR